MRTLLLVLPLVGCLPTEKEPDATDVFVATAPTEVDVLWVIDDTVSMNRTQETLAGAVEGFFDGYGAADLHVGVTTTDVETAEASVVTWTDGTCLGDTACLDAWVGTVMPGVMGDDQERAFGAALGAWSTPLADTTNAGFLRTGARHVLAVVSDEEDCTGGTGPTGQSCYDETSSGPSALLTPMDDVLLALVALDPAGDFQVSGIIGSTASTCDSSVPGTRYAEAVARTGGVEQDICAFDGEAVLADIATSAVAVSDRFRLSEAADPDSLVVTVDSLTGDSVGVTEDATNGWTYDEALWMVVLHGTALPAEGASIQVDYTPA